MTAVASHTKAQVSAGTASQAAASARFALGTRVLLALTRDQVLIALLRRVADPAHEVCVAGSEVDLGTVLVAQHGGVVVLDAAALATPAAELTLRLRRQFPDAVLIVAGSAGEQGALAAQITDGSVHRFLHRPFSEQRVRAFVESAWRRHAEGGTWTEAPAAPGAVRRRLTRALWIAVMLASLGAASAWYVLSTPPPHAPPPAAAAAPRAAAPAAGDPLLESLLARADQALARGELLAPAGTNAAELYREALRRNARDTRAANGLELVIDRLISDAEALLGAHRVDEAQQLADAAHAISPDHPRVAFLRAQIGTQRERALIDRAQRAAAAGNVAGALAVLDDAAHGGRSSTLVSEARVQLAQNQRVTDFLEHGRAALEAGQLIEPPEQSARFFFESARALAPADENVQQAGRDLIARLKSESSRAVAAGNANEAERWAAAAADAGADPVEVAQLRSAAQALRGERAASFERGVRLFDERLGAGRIVEPAGDSAKFYLEQLTKADADHPSTRSARSSYDTRLLDEARGAVKAQDFTAARGWLTEARAAGADATAVAALDANLSAAEQQAQQASAYVSASSLTRTHYVAAQFPPAALERGTDGWVDLEFTVRLDGSVGELTVLGAQPAGVFEQTALDAVRHWRYQPVKRGGETVTQRARVRVRFVTQR